MSQLFLGPLLIIENDMSPVASWLYGSAWSPSWLCLQFPLPWGAPCIMLVTRRNTWTIQYDYFQSAAKSNLPKAPTLIPSCFIPLLLSLPKYTAQFLSLPHIKYCLLPSDACNLLPASLLLLLPYLASFNCQILDFIRISVVTIGYKTIIITLLTFVLSLTLEYQTARCPSCQS